jgi:hypothetical protein
MSLRKHVFRLTLAGVVLGAGTLAEAQNVPPAAPIGPAPTLWHYLGLRQGSWMRRDAFLNRSGNRPGLERKPPLKRIADPGLAEIDNAAIKKAQQIKAEEDLAPQKIKAIKYLATLGCGKCYKGVDEALLESLKDCTEEVRYETVLALTSIPNAECPMCDNDCCTEAMTEELAKMAYERDPNHPDCWYEPSARIREAAAAAINVCCPNRGAPPMAEPIIDETPIEGGPRRTPVEGGTSAGRSKPSAAMFGGLYGRQPTKSQRQVAARRPAQAPHQIAVEQQAEPSSTIWIADQHANTQPQVRPIGKSAARNPLVNVLPEETQVDVAPDEDVYIDENVTIETPAESPTYESQASDAPVYAPAAVDEAVEATPYVEAGPAVERSPVADAGTTLEQPGSAPQISKPEPQAEEPVLEPVIRQPGNLTRRAKQPALIAATPIVPMGARQPIAEAAELEQPALVRPAAIGKPSTLIQQPSNFGNAIRRASAEEPAAYVEAISDEVQVPANDAQAAPARSAASVRQPASASAYAKPGVRGVVAKVSGKAGTVQLRFAGGAQPTIGSVVNVQHKYLLGTSQIGELEIVAAGSDMVTARAIGDTNLSKISSGDVVVLQTR